MGLVLREALFVVAGCLPAVSTVDARPTRARHLVADDDVAWRATKHLNWTERKAFPPAAALRNAPGDVGYAAYVASRAANFVYVKVAKTGGTSMYRCFLQPALVDNARLAVGQGFQATGAPKEENRLLCYDTDRNRDRPALEDEADRLASFFAPGGAAGADGAALREPNATPAARERVVELRARWRRRVVFATVRNPWRRVLSMRDYLLWHAPEYFANTKAASVEAFCASPLDIVRAGASGAGGRRLRRGGRRKPANLTEVSRAFHGHTAPQWPSLFTADGRPTFDFLVHLETADADFVSLISHINARLPETRRLPPAARFPHEQRSPTARRDVEACERLCGAPSCRDPAKFFYERDADLLGYTMPCDCGRGAERA